MKRAVSTFLVAAATAVLIGPAQAQDIGALQGMVGASVEGFGQSVAENVTGASSIFVTASGTAQAPDAGRAVYKLDLDASAPTDVEAVAKRDAKLKAIHTLAHRFTIEMQEAPATVAREPDRSGVEETRRAAMLARMRKPGDEPPPLVTSVTEPDRVFVARMPLRFRPTRPDQLAPFLDAMRTAGFDDLQLEKDASPASMFFGGLFGSAPAEGVPNAIWDEASRAAMAEARRQALVLAAAGGRTLGAVRQVISMTRTSKGGGAQVVIGVRFSLGDGQASPKN